MTTNFDRLFEATRIGIRLRNSGRVYNAPALPPGGRFTGIVNIHGVVDQPEDMVLTDSDIGRAYLEEIWALEFLQGIFRTQHVLFVGYSHQDPIIRYPARAMPTGNQPARRFILTHQPTVYGQSWTSLGIEPIVYQLGDDRRQLVLPVTSTIFAGRYGVIIRYGGTVDYRPTNQAIEAETYGRQDTGNGSGQGWDERAFSAQVAEWAIAVAGETGASVAHSAGSLRRGVGG